MSPKVQVDQYFAALERLKARGEPISNDAVALEAGKGRRQAAYEAKDLMDYSLRGNFAAAQWFTDVVPFLIVCALSGVALGTDLTLPSALLAGLIGQLGERGQREGAYFGWWSFAAKLNLALAAGLALPLLAWFGYTPGAREPEALLTLTIAYCLLPCALKLLAAGALYGLVIRPERRAAASRLVHTPVS